MNLLKLSVGTFQNEVGFSVVQEIIFIRVRIVVIPRHKVIKNKDQNTWKFGDYNLQNDLNSFIPVKPGVLKSSDPTRQLHSPIS